MYSEHLSKTTASRGTCTEAGWIAPQNTSAKFTAKLYTILSFELWRKQRMHAIQNFTQSDTVVSAVKLWVSEPTVVKLCDASKSAHYTVS
jgi:hypothetical protein